MQDINHNSSVIGEEVERLRELAKRVGYFYHTRKIKKKKGSRELSIPDKELKRIQRLILKVHLYKYPVHKSACGFIPRKSRTSNIHKHTSNKIIIKFDIYDFFPSISSGRIYGLFKSLGYDNETSILFTRLCTYNEKLPQGAPTSPYLSNLICVRLDARLSGLAEKWGLHYSRYADDMTLSGKGISKKTIEIIQKIIHEEGFQLNKFKTKIRSQKNRQNVTGIILNDKISLGHKKFNSLKAKLYSLSKNPIREEDVIKYKQKIIGEISEFKRIDPWKWYTLMKYFKLIDWKNNHIQHPKNKQEQVVNDIETLLHALNSNLKDVFRPRKEIFEAIKNNPKNSEEVFTFNLQKLHQIFTVLNGRLYFFFEHLSEFDKSEIKKSKSFGQHNNLMKRFANNNKLNVSVLSDVNILSGRNRHPNPRISREYEQVLNKYGFKPEEGNYSEVHFLILKKYKEMLEDLLKFVQRRKK